MDPLEALTRAVLYEGYLLWPYRPSALKNRRRWTLGGVFPADWSLAHPDDPCRVRAECLAEVDVPAGRDPLVRRGDSWDSLGSRGGPPPRARSGPPPRARSVPPVAASGARPAPSVSVRVRFLRAEARDGRAAEEDVSFGPFSLSDAGALPPAPFAVPGSEGGRRLEGAMTLSIGPVPEDSETRPGADGGSPGADGGSPAARASDGTRRTAALPEARGLVRIGVEVANLTEGRCHARDDASRLAFLSLHIALRAEGAAFVSLTDPPERWRRAALLTRQSGLWPVLIGEPGSRSAMLAAPIILPDHPRLAPESGGDFFDSTEIDQMLLLNVLGLTDEEREEMRSGDPRARRILERALGLDGAGMKALYGTLRDPEEDAR